MGATEPRAVYEELVRRHGLALYRLAYRLQGEPAMAEDLVQETFFHAWRSIASLRDPESGRAWLSTILRRRWIRHLGREGRRILVTEPTEPDTLASPLPGPDLELFARRESVQQALDRLDPRLKEAFLSVFMEGWSCRETADRLSIPLGTVLSRVHRARVRLRALLAEVPDHGGGRGRDAAAGGAR